MPRTHRQRLVGALLGVLGLLGATLGPVAAPAWASPLGQQPLDTPTQAIVVAIDEPTHRSGTSASRVLVRGWAANPVSQTGTGVARVDLYLDGGPDQGGQYLGRATYGRQRVDVAEALGGQRFLNSGWDIVVDIPRGPHTLVAVAAPTGPGSAVVIPGVASVRATIGGPPGRTEPGCGAGGYCVNDGGSQSSPRRTVTDSMYPGNLYVGYGTFGHGPTTPQYGWWDELLPDLVPYLVAWAASSYPNPQWFYGHVPALYDQNLLTSQATQGGLGILGSCGGQAAYAGMGLLGLSVFGGYQTGFPFIGGIGASTNVNLSAIGFGASTLGGPFGVGSPMSVPFANGGLMNSLYARGPIGAWNGGITGITSQLGGRIAGPGGGGAAFSSAFGGFYPGSFGHVEGDTLIRNACFQKL